MYQTIVFLPLLGAILAALISLTGARARHPGGRRRPARRIMPPRRSPSTMRAPRLPIPGRMPPARPRTREPEPHQPAALGSRMAELITTGLLFFSMILSWIVFVQVGFGHDAHVSLANWVVSGDLKFAWALRVDTLTAVMLVVVTTISALVHLYSIGYMAEDPHQPRFFCYLSLFTFAMLMLVTADNLVQLFFGWEGVGLMSYLLIGFWYHKPEANAAAIKAFIVNRVGDFGFSLGIFAVFMMTGAVDFDTVFAQAPGLAGKTIDMFGHHADALTLICLLLFTGAMGKSAQFLLHTWLPDAMEGPTPVSALIHAATMVTAGVFMVARLSPLFELAPNAQTFVITIGATTALFAATVGLVQNDIKRIVAYSTCSQLGYMFVAMGVGAYSVGMFHLFTHAFFKALLFLGSGSVITAMHHEQDIRHMGGLKAPHPAHLLGDGDRDAGAHRVSAHGRLFLQGRHHRGGLCGRQSDGDLRLPVHGRRRRADLVLFLAADLQDLPRQAARSPSLRGGAREPARHAGAARGAGRRLAARRLSVQGPVHRPRRRGVLPPVAEIRRKQPRARGHGAHSVS